MTGSMPSSVSIAMRAALIALAFAFAPATSAAVFQAEDYTAFHDTTPGNAGATYRSDDVDIYPTRDAGGGHHVGQIAAGEWLAWRDLEVPSAGRYTLRLRVSSPVAATASVDLDGGAIVLASLAIPATGDAGQWTTLTRTVTLPAGRHQLGVYAQSGGWLFNWIELVPVQETLAWADEFDTADPGNWTFETGGGGWGNNERQYYTAGQNSFIQYDAGIGSNVLVIEARRGAPAGASCWYGACEYSSSRMITRGKQVFRYGRIEARIRLPQTQGIWPAFWMLGEDIDRVGWPQSGEIDIMEHVGFEPTLTHGALHGPGYSGNTPLTGTHDLGQRADAAYHVYAVDWDAQGITWSVDDRAFYSVSRAEVEARGRWVFDQPFFLLLNVAVGGNWPGSPDTSSTFPQRMYVDYVRVYQTQAPLRRGRGSAPLLPRPATAAGAARPAPRAPAGRPVPLD